MIDHLAEAARLLEVAREVAVTDKEVDFDRDAYSATLALRAQAHATIALVESFNGSTFGRI